MAEKLQTPNPSENEAVFDEEHPLDEALRRAAGKIGSVLCDPVVPRGPGALISISIARRELAALKQLLTACGVEAPPTDEYLPSTFDGHQN